jgi:TPR repeat protein
LSNLEGKHAKKMGERSTQARRIFGRAKAYFNGTPSKNDYACGLKLLKQAASLGQVGAHEWLGAAYDYGLGTRPNRRLAFEHYLIAAQARNPNSEYHVGIFYYAGIGVRKNRVLGPGGPGCD